MNLDSDEIIVDLSGADCKNSISGNHPNNREDVHHDPPDLGLIRSRKEVAAKTNLIITSQPQQQVEEGTGGQLKTESGIIELAIPSTSQTDNSSASEILETPEATSSVTLGSHLMASPGQANDDHENGRSPTRPPFRELSEVHSSTIVSCSGSNVFDVQTPQAIKRRMIKTASQTGFYTLPNTLDKSKDLMNPDEQNNRNITIEREAKAAGYLISKNVAKRGYIKEEDLLCFMNKEEVDIVLPLIGGEEESGRINEKSFFNWVVSMYMKGKFLEHSIDDINEVMKKLVKFFNVLLVAVLIIFWAILDDIASKDVMLFISSQFLLAVFTIGGSAKSTFEAMIFLFVKYPFDVGDRCVIDGLQVVVEEVSILTTVFLKHDNEKIYYPNSELATKSISNFSRSPEMRDIVEFDLDVSTSAENISALKAEIKKYIDSNPHLWQPEHRVRVREIEDVKMKMRLYITHTINFQNYEEISDNRSNLVLELRNISRQLGIKCDIYPPTSSD